MVQVEKDVEMKDAPQITKDKAKQAASKKKLKNGKPVVEEEELSEEDQELKSRLELYVERAKDTDTGVQVPDARLRLPCQTLACSSQ